MEDDINQRIKDFSEIRKQHFDSFLPIFNKHDDIYINIFSVFATLSATIGAFSFLLFDINFSIKKETLIKGDLLLLIVISSSVFCYLFFSKRNHSNSIKYYNDFQNKINKSINYCESLKKGEINVNEYTKRQNSVNEETRKSVDNTILTTPTYSPHLLVFICFIYALIFIGLSLMNI